MWPGTDEKWLVEVTEPVLRDDRRHGNAHKRTDPVRVRVRVRVRKLRVSCGLLSSWRERTHQE